MEQKIWWYALNNEQKGPVTQEELNLLVNQNFMSPGTLVWKEGLPNWVSYSDINGPVEVETQRPPQPPVLSQAAVSQLQPVNGNPQQANGYSQPAQAFSQPSQTYSQPATPQSNNYNPQSNFNAQPNYSSQPNTPQPNFNQQPNNGTPNPLNFVIDYYYRVEFEKIIASNETYKGRWNWWAFFFNWIWALYKGLWQYAILFAVPITVLPFFFPEMFIISKILGVASALFFGMRGNWIFYNKQMKHKQLF